MHSKCKSLQNLLCSDTSLIANQVFSHVFSCNDEYILIIGVSNSNNIHNSGIFFSCFVFFIIILQLQLFDFLSDNANK